MSGLSEDQIERARQLLAAGLTYKAVGQRLGCHGTTVHAALDAEFARQRQQQRSLRRDAGNAAREFSRQVQEIIAERAAFQSDAAARLAEIPPDTRSLTARIAGDPLPGRSAFDRKGLSQWQN